MTHVARGWTAKDNLTMPPVTAPAIPPGLEGSDGVAGLAGLERGRWRRAMAAVRAALSAVAHPQLKRPYYPPLREGFVEDAAMAREMRRL